MHAGRYFGASVFVILVIFSATDLIKTTLGDRGCRVAHCDRCEGGNPLRCTSCQKGYTTFPHDTSRCIPCGRHCATCSQPGKCTTCMMGYGPSPKDKSSCLPCGEKCLACQTSGAGKCDQCRPHFFLNPRKRKCSYCGNGCKRCDKRGPLKCEECLEGYGVAYTRCRRCPKNCAKCSLAKHCDQCNPGFGPSMANKDICGPCPINCANCNVVGNGKCLQCLPQYFLSARGNRCIWHESFDLDSLEPDMQPQNHEEC